MIRDSDSVSIIVLPGNYYYDACFTVEKHAKTTIVDEFDEFDAVARRISWLPAQSLPTNPNSLSHYSDWP
eukprot:scaffold792_cov153-Ochromonas_danica.AAC.2